MSFLTFLEHGNEQELGEKRELLEELLRKINPRCDAASDIRFCLRKIDEEFVARNEVLFFQNQRSK